MAFRSDASLKGVSRRSGGNGGRAPGRGGFGSAGSDGAADLIEKAKRERETREYKRRMFGHAVRLQSCWRRHRSAAATRASQRVSLAQKLDDVAKVSAAFQQAGIPFLPSAETAHALLLRLPSAGTPASLTTPQPSCASCGWFCCRRCALERKLNFASDVALFSSSSNSGSGRGNGNSSGDASVHSPAVFRLRRLVAVCLEHIAANCLAASVAGIGGNRAAAAQQRARRALFLRLSRVQRMRRCSLPSWKNSFTAILRAPLWRQWQQRCAWLRWRHYARSSL